MSDRATLLEIELPALPISPEVGDPIAAGDVPAFLKAGGQVLGLSGTVWLVQEGNLYARFHQSTSTDRHLARTDEWEHPDFWGSNVLVHKLPSKTS